MWCSHRSGLRYFATSFESFQSYSRIASISAGVAIQLEAQYFATSLERFPQLADAITSFGVFFGCLRPAGCWPRQCSPARRRGAGWWSGSGRAWRADGAAGVSRAPDLEERQIRRANFPYDIADANEVTSGEHVGFRSPRRRGFRRHIWPPIVARPCPRTR
jgi:hypothetical protein